MVVAFEVVADDVVGTVGKLVAVVVMDSKIWQ
jgi:hypothetical protein